MRFKLNFTHINKHEICQPRNLFNIMMLMLMSLLLGDVMNNSAKLPVESFGDGYMTQNGQLFCEPGEVTIMDSLLFD